MRRGFQTSWRPPKQLAASDVRRRRVADLRAPDAAAEAQAGLDRQGIGGAGGASGGAYKGYYLENLPP